MQKFSFLKVFAQILDSSGANKLLGEEGPDPGFNTVIVSDLQGPPEHL